MFAIPITIPFHDGESVSTLPATVEIDKIVVVKSLLDKSICSDVESKLNSSLLPMTELQLEDGRKLPVLETAAAINRYLDAHRQLEDFYTSSPTAAEVPKGGVVLQLFQGGKSCASSEVSTPA